MLDLGAGSGRLTAELARAGARVIAVELDPDLAGRLQGRWERVEAICADAAAVELPDEPFRVVANLPFRGRNEILRHLFDDPRVPLVRADLVLEWGVAVKRGLPWPSSVNSVVWGAWYSIEVARQAAAERVRPAPSVDAGVLVLTRRSGRSCRFAARTTTAVSSRAASGAAAGAARCRATSTRTSGPPCS